MGTSGKHGGAAQAPERPGISGQGRDEHEDMLPILEDWLTPDEVEQIGDLGGGDDDVAGPEQVKEVHAGGPREAYLVARVKEACRALAAHRAKRRTAIDEEGARVPDEVWRRLGDEALGLSDPAGRSGPPCNAGAPERAADGLPPGIAVSMRSNLIGFMRVMSWIEAGALRDGRGDVLRAIRALIAREPASRMPR